MSKALEAAIARRELMIAANAPADTIAMVDARIAALTPTPKTEVEVESPVLDPEAVWQRIRPLVLAYKANGGDLLALTRTIVAEIDALRAESAA